MAVEGNCNVADVIEVALLGAGVGEQVDFDTPPPSIVTRIRWAKELVDTHTGKNLEDISYILYKHIGAGMKSYGSIPLSLGIFYASKGTYANGLLATINIGDEADTNRAIVGALCGAFSGVDAINKSWIEQIQGTNKLDLFQIANDLLYVKDAIA